jgi:hypothetical protein
MRRRPRIALVLILCAGAIVPACGAAFDGTTYRGPGYAFRLPPRPESWQRVEAEGVNLAFRDAQGSSTIAVSARCGKDADDVPLEALTRHLFIQFTEREYSIEETVPFDGREARHTVMTAKLDGVPKKFDFWVLKKDGCVYDLYLIAEPARFEAVAAEFRKLVSGFATVPVDG